MTNLTDAQRERLYMLAEEAAEIVQITNKILRHGYESYHPEDEEKTPNSKLLVDEIIDFTIIVKWLEEAEDITAIYISDEQIDNIEERKRKYTHYQESKNE